MKLTLGLNSEELNDESKEQFIQQFDGVGLIRGENLCIAKMQYFTISSFQKYVTEYLSRIAKKFEGKEVWYRTADLIPQQVSTLDGCDAEFKESHFLIGTRGIRRNLKYPEAFLKELATFVEAARENGNLGIIIPFVSKPEEMQVVINVLMGKFNYKGKIGMMLEIPSTIIRLDEFEQLGIDHYTIGMNDLTSFILGAGRDNSSYNMNDKAVLDFLASAVRKIHSYGKEVNVAGYLNKETVENCRRIGVDSACIHYNLIPQIFPDVENPEDYTKHYNSIKANYKRIKREKNNLISEDVRL